MARKRLTALAVQNFKATDKRQEVSDGRGLALVIQPKPSGAKSWCFRYRRKVDGRPRKLTFDGALTLVEARASAAEALRQVKLGGDPAAEKQREKKAQRQAAAERAADTVDTLVARFIELYAKRMTRTWRVTERAFKRDVLPVWSGRSAHDIKKRDIIALIDGIAADRPIQANRIFALVRKFFAWCVERDVLGASPCQGVKPPAPERQRDRVLSDSEVVKFWNATRDDPAGSMLRTLLLTGQRRGEVSGMCWSEIDDAERTWTLPPTRTKNGQTHIVPLSSQAWSIIEAMPRIVGNDFVFAGDRLGYGRIKQRLDAQMPDVPPWVFHDCRRTLATGLQRLGVRLEVTESVLNHTSGSRAGIVGIYQKHDWKDEKRVALQRWADHIDALVAGRPGKVIQLDARR
ncbi:MAG: tyrosine-type recombinase/integrase [Xanthobacteraceae bacterium]